MAVTNQALPASYQLLNYRIDRQISRGGFSIVYRAFDETGAPVAIKEYLPSSLVLRTSRHRVFFSGDTGLTAEYGQIRERLGPFDLVMLEVGAHHPAWGDIHLGPDNALLAWQLLGGGPFLPIHWGTFSLALHAWDQPAEVLLARAPALGVPLLMPRLGEAVEPAHVDGVTPWWRGVDTPERMPLTPEQAEAEVRRWPKAVPWPAD